MAWGFSNYKSSDSIYLPNVACSVATSTANFVTVFDRRITTDHVVACLDFANPANITSKNVTCTTTDGKLTINGTCSAATNVNILLIRAY